MRSAYATMVVELIILFFSGLRCLSIREASSTFVYVPEKEPQQEGDGVLLIMQLCEISSRIVQLHRYLRTVHPCWLRLFYSSLFSVQSGDLLFLLVQFS